MKVFTLICVIVAIACGVCDALTKVKYSNGADSDTIDMTNKQCSNIAARLNDKTITVEADDCVIAYKDGGCKGEQATIEMNSACAKNVKNCHMDGRISAFGPCKHTCGVFDL